MKRARVAIECESSDDDSVLAVTLYYYLGFAHKSLGREGGVARAISLYQKAIEMKNKVFNNEHHQIAFVTDLALCYVTAGRIQEAMDLHKSRLVADFRKELLEPDYILQFTTVPPSRGIKSLGVHFKS